MQNASSFARMLKQAVDWGQVVLIPGPDQPPSPAPAPPPLHDRDEVSLAALCLVLKLKRSEGQMLVRLMTHDCSTVEELRSAAAHADKTITAGTTQIFLSSMRKKLATYNVRINTIPTLGYALDGKARDKIHKLLSEHDKAIRPLAK